MGRSVWEFNIDPKRLREEIKNGIALRRKKRDEKKSIKSDKKNSKRFGTGWPGNEGRPGKR